MTVVAFLECTSDTGYFVDMLLFITILVIHDKMQYYISNLESEIERINLAQEQFSNNIDINLLSIDDHQVLRATASPAVSGAQAAGRLSAWMALQPSRCAAAKLSEMK